MLQNYNVQHARVDDRPKVAMGNVLKQKRSVTKKVKFQKNSAIKKLMTVAAKPTIKIL